MKRYMLMMLAAAACLSGCGDKYGLEARHYVGKAIESLVAQGVCKDADDCSRRNVAFFAGAKPWGEQTHVLIYGISDPHTIENVAAVLREERKRLGPGVIVIAYSSEHGQPEKKLKRIEIE